MGHRVDTMECNLVTYLPVELNVHDNIRTNYAVFHSLFRRGEHEVVLQFTCLVLTVISSIVMCSSAGHTDGSERITASRVHSIFYELIWLLPLLATVLAAMAMQEFAYHVSSYRMIAIFCAGMVLVIAACCTFWLYTTAIRAKNGTFWTSFGVVRLFRFFFSLFRTNLLSTFAAVGYLFFLFALHLLVHRWSYLLMLPLMFVDLITLIGVAYCIYSYFELHRHVRHMENGDFEPAEHPVALGGDFARFDSSLEQITDRVGEIVAQQTRAEHLRTELITNVSHDLKTPLTSIVNYVDLLSREPMQSEAAAEYLDVLKRQAARLKKLTIDLVDASKASTGNLTVELVPTNIPVLLSQLAGEYEEQLAAKDMTLILNVPQEPITILADGRQIWRVFDNLLNNAYKYTLPGTRIYLEVQTGDDQVVITVKNISASPLNISADALMERFVRGDSSRHTEGSGLGLSIARDLTKLQNGVLELKTDGDLFKAILRFPLYHAPEPPAEEQDDAAPDPDAPADEKPDDQA
jgi:signal transduction histidine kinase